MCPCSVRTKAKFSTTTSFVKIRLDATRLRQGHISLLPQCESALANAKQGFRNQTMDTRTPEQRRRIMQSVGAKDTAPELTVRRILFRLGYRYRLHRKDLPGRPDIAFVGRKKAIFVHGCFWHSHDCPKGRAPKSRIDYWQAKRQATVDRDRRNIEKLNARGWTVLIVWQCELRDLYEVSTRLQDFVGQV